MKQFLKKLPARSHAILARMSGQFYSYHSTPVRAKDHKRVAADPHREGKVAVVMQGAIVTDFSYTLETLRLYKQALLPKTEIILSTWQDADPVIISEIALLGIHVVQQKKPENTGISNINLQILSTRMGIAKASELGATHVLKTRTDVRMYATDIEDFLLSALECYPKLPQSKQKQRIIAFDLNTFKGRPYSISDISLFGSIFDMNEYWSLPLDTRTKDTSNARTLIEWSKARMCEVYLSAHYLEQHGRTLSWTVEDSIRAIAEYFIILDASTLDLHWFKYAHWKIWRNKNYHQKSDKHELSFREWLIAYIDLIHE